jgi:hypothetical protein
MRIGLAALFISCVCLAGCPAAAKDRGAPTGVRPLSFLNFWQQRLTAQPPAQPLARRGTRRSHASASCLPGTMKAVLNNVQARYGPVTVISTHRPGARIRGGRPSLHASCEAVDFRPARGTYGRVAAYLRSTWNGGMGTYSSGHIHIDTGPKYHWHSGGGRRKRG